MAATGVDVERLWTIYGPAFATTAISWGNFPPTPKRIRNLQLKYGVPLQYLALFNLSWQGGARNNATIAAIITAIFFVLNQFLNY